MKKLLVLSLLTLLLAVPAAADEFVTNQSPDVVLGQPDFVSGSSDSKPNRFNNPYGVVRDPTTGKVFIADTFNHRILRFSSEAAARSGSNPEAVFGQPNFNSYDFNQGQGVNAGQQTLGEPWMMSFDQEGRLWVADSANNRVLGYYAASFRGSNPSADFVFGQPDFTTSSAGTSSSKTSETTAVFVDQDDILWVVDRGNDRVLRFDDISNKANGAAADGVLGQPDFGSSGNATTATGLRNPTGLFVDGAGTLWVCDGDNERVLRYDDAKNKGDGAAADGVLGQPDFTTEGNNLTATGMEWPFGVYLSPEGTLFVGDYGYDRILGYKGAAGLTDGSPADFVLGQPDFESGGSSASSIGAIQICEGPAGSIFAVDYDNSRVLRFTPFRTPTIRFSRARAVSRRPVYTAVGRTTGVVNQVSYRHVGQGGFRPAQGNSVFRARLRLRPGRNIVLAYADGPGGRSATASQTVIYNQTRSRARQRALARLRAPRG